MPVSRNVSKNQTLLYQGEAPSSVYLVRSGLVRAYSIVENGEERTIALFSAGDFFPIGTALGKAPVALFYYETVVDSEIDFLSKEEFTAKLQEDQTAAINKIATQHLSGMLHINALGQPSARATVIHILQYLSLRFGAPLSGKTFTKIDVQLTQHDLAKLCGLTRETIAVELGALKKDGAVAVKQKYYSVNNRQLVKILGESEINQLKLG